MYECSYPLCLNLIPSRGYCPLHADQAPVKAEQRAHYDRYQRHKGSKSFYNSAAWKNPLYGARARTLREHPFCQNCNRVLAEVVHHEVPLSELPEGDERRLGAGNLVSLCSRCHNSIEARGQR